MIEEEEHKNYLREEMEEDVKKEILALLDDTITDEVAQMYDAYTAAEIAKEVLWQFEDEDKGQHKPTIKADPYCKICLGSGISLNIVGGEAVCNCVTQQLNILITEQDYSIPAEERNTPKKVVTELKQKMQEMKELKGESK